MLSDRDCVCQVGGIGAHPASAAFLAHQHSTMWAQAISNPWQPPRTVSEFLSLSLLVSGQKDVWWGRLDFWRGKMAWHREVGGSHTWALLFHFKNRELSKLFLRARLVPQAAVNVVLGGL